MKTKSFLHNHGVGDKRIRAIEEYLSALDKKVDTATEVIEKDTTSLADMKYGKMYLDEENDAIFVPINEPGDSAYKVLEFTEDGLFLNEKDGSSTQRTKLSPRLTDLTPEERASLKGDKGDQGDSAVYDPSSPDAPDFVMANTTGQSTTKAMTQKAVTDALSQLGSTVVRKSDYCNVGDYTKESISLTSGGYYNYKLNPVSYVEMNGFACKKITDVVAGDMYQFSGYIAYSNLAAVVFLDAQDKCIGYLYGNNNSTGTRFDTGIISIPIGCSSVAFNAYTGGGVAANLLKYTLPKALTEADVSGIVIDTINPDGDMLLNSVPVDVGHFYDGTTLNYTTNAAFSCAVANVSPTDKVSYKGKVRYGSLYAVIFADDLGNIIDRIGHSQSEASVDTGIIPVPTGATKVYFGAYGSTFTAYIYNEPKIVNEVSFQEYYAKGQNSVKYCNPYHYVMGISQPDDIVNSGFDANFESSTEGAFLIHDKYFRSYRRKHEWHVYLSATSVIKFGTGNNSNSIVVNSRMSQFIVDVPNALLKIYNSAGSQVTTVSLDTIDISAEHILRYEQYDYTTRVSVINKATLDVVAFYTNTASPSASPLGKLIGRPFIVINAGSLKVTRYDCYLMDKPKIVFIGDSITECGYRQDTYAAMLIREKLNNNGCIIAQGGANNDVLSAAKTAELIHMKPEYLSLLIGTNGTITAGDIQSWVSFCQENDIKIILNCVPVSLDVENYPWTDKNATIRSQGVLGANFDYATALNNDPDDGGNSALFGDEVHPNAAGQNAMYNRFLNDVRIFD